MTDDTDAGVWQWGGNLVVHKLYQIEPTKDLAITIPHTLKAHLETHSEPIIKHSQWGNVAMLASGASSYRLSSSFDADIANVLFEPIHLSRYMITVTILFERADKDFGFMFGACDGYDNFYSLRFVPSQNRFSFDKIQRSLLTNTTVAVSDVPFTLTPNTDLNIHIIVENSLVVTYLNHRVALSTRIYRPHDNSWGIYTDKASAIFKNLSVSKP